MAKKSTSRFIEQFLYHVKSGHIVGTDGTSGPAILKRTAKQLQELLDGRDPDEVFDILRTTGPESNEYTLPLALRIHDARSKKEKWAVIHCLASDWLARQGHKPLSLSRLKTLYKEQQSEIQRIVSWREFNRFIEEHK